MAQAGPFFPNSNTNAYPAAPGWTNPNNAHVSDNTYATCTKTGAAGTIGTAAYQDWRDGSGNSPFDVIPAGSTIDSLYLEIDCYTTGNSWSWWLLAYHGTTQDIAGFSTGVTVSETSEVTKTYTWTDAAFTEAWVRGDGATTGLDAGAGGSRICIRAYKGSSTGTSTASLDVVRLYVNYTNNNADVTPAAAAVAVAGVAPSVSAAGNANVTAPTAAVAAAGVTASAAGHFTAAPAAASVAVAGQAPTVTTGYVIAVDETVVQPYRVFQRDIPTNEGSILLEGTYTGGTPSTVEAYFDTGGGGTWGTLDNLSIAGGAWSGSIQAAPGTGTVYVRGTFTGPTYSTDSVTPIMVGDIFIIAGQSNAEGWATEYYPSYKSSDTTWGLPGPYTGTEKAGMLWVYSVSGRHQWRELIEPSAASKNPTNLSGSNHKYATPTWTGSGATYVASHNEYASWVSYMVGYLMEATGVPVGIVNVGVGGSAAEGWDRASDADFSTSSPSTTIIYEELTQQLEQIAGIANSGSGHAKPIGMSGFARGIIFYQGETDIGDASPGSNPSQSGYSAKLAEIVDDWWQDFGLETLVVSPGWTGTGTYAAFTGTGPNGHAASPYDSATNVRLAQQDAWDSVAHVQRGPHLYELNTSSVHLDTNAELVEVAKRIGQAVSQAWYPDPIPYQGVWILRNIAASSELSSDGTAQWTSISNAMDIARGVTPGSTAAGPYDDKLAGFSLRFPWNICDLSTDPTLASDSTSVINRALARVASYNASRPSVNIGLSVRFMAGQWTPSDILSGGPTCNLHTDTVSPYTPVPAPWTTSTNTFNELFETRYELFVSRLAAWCRSNGVDLLHMAWHGGEWAELYYDGSAPSPAIQDLLPGSQYASNRLQFEEACKRLIRIGWRYAGEDLTVEFPLSGRGPITGSVAANAIVDELGAYMQTLTGGGYDRRLAFQANGWGGDGSTSEGGGSGVLFAGEWGHNGDPTSEGYHDRCFAFSVIRGLQDIYPAAGDEDNPTRWTRMFASLAEENVAYCELYDVPVVGTNTAGRNELQAQIGAWTPYDTSADDIRGPRIAAVDAISTTVARILFDADLNEASGTYYTGLNVRDGATTRTAVASGEPSGATQYKAVRDSFSARVVTVTFGAAQSGTVSVASGRYDYSHGLTVPTVLHTDALGTIDVTLPAEVFVRDAIDAVALPSAASCAVAGVTPAAQGTVIATPTAASVTVAGVAPAVITGVIITPTAASATAAAVAPATIGLGRDVTAPTASVAATAVTPTSVTTSAAVTPTAASVAATGVAPAISAGVELTPTAGSVAVAGVNPSVSASGGANVNTAAATVAAAGVAPAVTANVAATPAAASTAAAGVAPTIAAHYATTPTAAAVTATAVAPSVSTAGNANVTAPTAAVAVVGTTPAASAAGNATATPAAASAAAAAILPSLSASSGATPAAAAVTAAGQAPSVSTSGNVNVSAPVATATADGVAPAAATSSAATPTAAACIVSAVAPVASAAAVLFPTAASCTAAATAPSLSTNHIVAVVSASCAVVAVAPTPASVVLHVHPAPGRRGRLRRRWTTRGGLR